MLSFSNRLLDKVANLLEKIELQLLFWTELLVVGRLLATGVLATHISHVAREVTEVIRPVLLLVGENLPRHIVDRVLGSGVTCVHGSRLVLVHLLVMGALLLLFRSLRGK